MRIVESLFNVASTYLPAVATGAITSAATKNPAHFSRAMLGTMTFQEFNNLSADGLAYLVNDKPVSLEMFNSNVAKYKKELKDSRQYKDWEVEELVEQYTNDNYYITENEDGSSKYIQQGLHPGDAWFAIDASVYTTSAIIAATEGFALNRLGKLFNNVNANVFTGKRISSTMINNVVNTIRKMPGSTSRTFQISKLHASKLSPIFKGALIEGTEESVQYLAQVHGATNKYWGYKTETFAEEWDWSNQLESTLIGGLFGGGLGGIAVGYNQTLMGSRLDNWFRARNKSNFFNSYVQKNKEKGGFDTILASPEFELEITDEGTSYEPTGNWTKEVVANHKTFGEAIAVANQQNRKYSNRTVSCVEHFLDKTNLREKSELPF